MTAYSQSKSLTQSMHWQQNSLRTNKSKKNNDASRLRRGSAMKTLQCSSVNSSMTAVIWIYKSDCKLWAINTLKNEDKLYSNNSLATHTTRRSGSWKSGWKKSQNCS